MTKQFDARYRITVYSKDETTIVEYPITCKFNVTRGVFAQSHKATIQLYNLAPTTRNQIFQDQLNLDPVKFKYVRLEAGWNGTMSEIFVGRIMQAYSFKSGGQTDVITEIQAVALDIFDCQTSHTFAEGTSFKDALKTMASDMPNVILGNTGSLDGIFQTPTTFDGMAMEEINKLTGGHSFVDNGVLNTLMDNEVIDVPVPVISNYTTLLETPMRRDANLEVKALFLPDLIVGQLVEVDSSISPDFNGQFKLVGFTHDCLISPPQAGNRTTQLVLWIGALLPNSDIAITGGAAPVEFSKVKGEDVSAVNPTTTQPKWIMPCKGNPRLSSPYGNRLHPTLKVVKFHDGVDIAVPLNTKVLAVADGTVTRVLWNGGYGKYIEIDHGNSLKSFYAHLNSWSVKQEENVKQGQVIGLSGNTAGIGKNGKIMTTGPHLHFGASKNGKTFNPLTYIN